MSGVEVMLLGGAQLTYPRYLGALRLAAMGPHTSRQKIFLMPLGGWGNDEGES